MTSFDRLKQATAGIFSSFVIWIAITVAIALLWTGYHFFQPATAYSIQTTADVRNLIVSGVDADDQFTTAKTTVKATVVIKQVAAILNIPIGQTNLVYEGIGTVRAGLPLAQLEVIALDLDQHQVQISLPAPTIAEVSLDVDRSSTLASYRNWFGHTPGAEIYEEAQRQAIAKIRQEACANHILDVANTNAVQSIRQILTKVGFETVVIDTRSSVPDSC